ncbi:MAG: glutamate--tRNA ligase [Bacteroidales bacterium]|nr:glutamate--tRNA ligase [Bacteroidales bacterium]MDD4669869.1 glutamate--tRNA ligase [Bacteroidales bacterium]
MKKRRVRFAPSPTGPLHIGGVRTALYNYLYAKQAGGDFILRIEDTDSQRFVPGAEEYIIDALRWCGITPDEGVDENGKVVETPSERHPHAPYRQSQRRGIYRKYAEELVEKGYAYYAFDTAEELDTLRKNAEAQKSTFTYNYATRGSLRNSLTLPASEVSQLIENETHWTIRFKIPENRTIRMNDLIRGEIEVNSNTLDDKVLWKRIDELPTYHLANIVDDHLMEITEVVRGEEWLPSLPLHYLLYEAFGWQESRPRFAHLSLLLKPDGKGKLSKRDGDRLGFPVFPLKWINAEGEVSRGYREDGYYPQAFVNLLALLGWNPGTEQEIFSLEELVQAFSLERVIKSGAKFNPDKAKWFNEQYLRMQTTEELTAEFKALEGGRLVGFSDSYIGSVCEIIKERAHFSNEFWGLSSYFFRAPSTYDPSSISKYWKDDVKPIIPQVHIFICNLEPFTKEHIEEQLHTLITDNQWPMGKVMNLLRLFLVGESKGPSVADIMALLGKEEVDNRIKRALNHLA